MSFGRFGPRDVERLETETLFKGFSDVQRHRLRHRLFAGGWSPPFEREVVMRPVAAAVLPYDPARDAVVLIEQFRLPALLAGAAPWQVEVVAGLLDKEQDPALVARREAQEEAGLELLDLWPIAELLVSPGGTTEVQHFFLGRIDAAGVVGLHGLADEQEDIRPQLLAFEAAWALLESGGIGNATAWICLAWLKLNRDKVRAAWT